MEMMPCPIADIWRSDFDAFTAAMQRGVVGDRVTSDRTNWAKWADYCHSLRVPANLTGIKDPVPLLQVFAHRV